MRKKKKDLKLVTVAPSETEQATQQAQAHETYSHQPPVEEESGRKDQPCGRHSILTRYEIRE